MGNKTFDFSSKKKDFLPKNDQIWPKIGIFGRFGPAMQAFSVPCWWVSWWLRRAGCISQDTYLLYMVYDDYEDNDDDDEIHNDRCKG